MINLRYTTTPHRVGGVHSQRIKHADRKVTHAVLLHCSCLSLSDYPPPFRALIQHSESSCNKQTEKICMYFTENSFTHVVKISAFMRLFTVIISY